MKYHIKSVSETLMTSTMVFLITAASTVLILALHQLKQKNSLFLFTAGESFYSGQVNNFTMDKIQAVNDSLSDAVVIYSSFENIVQANMLFYCFKKEVQQ